jgi:DNA-directed RNA polymerase subunit beta'
MIIGCYYLTEVVEGAPGEGRVFSSLDEAVLAYDQRLEPVDGAEWTYGIDLHAKIKVRMPAARFPADEFPERDEKHPDRVVLRRHDSENGSSRSGAATGDPAGATRSEPTGTSKVLVESTVGRLLFNEAFPPDFPYTRTDNAGLKKRELTAIVGELVERYSRAEVAQSLDNLKDLGFEYSTRAGLTISMADVKTPASKRSLLDHFEAEAEKIEQQYDRGIITDDERRQKEIEIWTDATDQVREAMETEMSSEQFNPIDMMVGSGARGNIVQVRQIAGMRGLVANPRGEIIPRPVKSSFREGLSVLEYFISTHGARKGLADTALRTADSGYLTRRLVDVAQELIVRDEDCGTTRGIWVEGLTPDADTRLLDTRLHGRCLLEDVKLSDGATMPRDTEIREEHVDALINDGKSGVGRVRVRSVLTCESLQGVCARCYGTMLATGKPVDLGEAVGIIAAQSIGEPGTQLTMRTFHTGGVAGEDITHGLPRVVELFEARTPKGAAVLAEASGVVRMGENEKGERVIYVVANDGAEEEHVVSRRAHLYDGARGPKIKDGAEVNAGDQLTGDDDTPRDPKKILEVKGIRETQQYLADEVQKVYREQGVSIHDKHVEVIVRQMLRRVAVSEPGDSPFLPGEKVDARLYAETNRTLVEDGKQPAEGRPELMGITKASLATDSWLSAASFQETTRVLTEAAIEGKTDGLFGLKENVIIGKLIPAGTGMPVYREITTEAPDYEPLPFYSTDIDAEAMAAYLRDSIGSPAAPEVAEGEGVATLTVVDSPEPPYEGTGTEE